MKEAGYYFLMMLMFWNLENFFDPFAQRQTYTAAQTDSLSGGTGDEYTPRGEKHWTWRKFSLKRDLIAKTIMASKEEFGQFPAVIGVCEVENRYVLSSLLEDTPLAALDYKIIHKDSPDKRGIDVAMLYREKAFRIIGAKFLPEKAAETYRTRYVLYVKGVCMSASFGEEKEWLDTLHLFVNHWPSKLGGEKKSMKSRMAISGMVKSEVDSILERTPDADIVLMGDFNDTPDSKPVMNLSGSGLVNLMEGCSGGTYKYRGKWEYIDQFMVSRHLFCDEGKEAAGAAGVRENGGGMVRRPPAKWIFCTQKSVSAFRFKFLMERDNRYLDEKIKRTLSGPRFVGGASDHLPVVLKIFSPAAVGKD